MVDRNIMEMIIADRRQLTDKEVERIRKNGEGNGFTVLDPADGFRGDGSLWFGTCSACGERVSNSWLDGAWEHTVYTARTYYETGMVATSTSYQTDYCPTARGEGLSDEK